MKQPFAKILCLSFLFALMPTVSAKDVSTSNAVKVDDSAKMLGTQVKTYEERTNTRRSLRTAANQMQDAARKDRSQTTPGTATGSVKTSKNQTVSKVSVTKKKSATTK